MGISGISNTSERDEASAVTKVHISNALVGWRANEYASTMQEFQRVRSAGDSAGETDLREFLLKNIIRQFSNCSACRRVFFFERPVSFHLCDMSAKQTRSERMSFSSWLKSNRVQLNRARKQKQTDCFSRLGATTKSISLYKRDQVTSNERELIIVGDGSSGKVSILWSLRAPDSRSAYASSSSPTFSSQKQKERSQNSTMLKRKRA